jgi:hypothetical protein
MQPGTGDVHVDGLLTNMSIAYKNSMYIAERIFPIVPVNFQSDIIPRYDKSYWFRDLAKELSDTEAPPASGYEVDNTMTYFCREYGIGHLISDRTRANAEAPYDPDIDGMEWLVDRLDMRNELAFVTNFWKTTVWTTDWVGGTNFEKWDLYATSTPIIDIRSAKRTIRRLIAREPNILVLGDLTWDRLADHPSILDRIKFSASSANPAMVTPNLLAQLTELEDVPVGISIYTSDEEGTAEGSVSYSAAWDDDALLLFRPNRPSLKTPAAGYNFVWRTVWGGKRYIRRRREPLSEKADLLEAFEWTDQKVTAPDAGLFFSDAAD